MRRVLQADRANATAQALDQRLTSLIGDLNENLASQEAKQRRERAESLLAEAEELTDPNVRNMEMGDHVLFSPEDRYEVEVRGEEFIILRERDIHAVAAERLEEAGTGLYL